VDKQLVVNDDEAQQVRATFDLYLELGTLREVVAELRRRGWRNKRFIGKHGREVIGGPFTKATLHALLTNIVYRGLMHCANEVVAGAHQEIVDARTWDAVQAQLQENSNNGGAAARNKAGATLRGLVSCGRCGSAMLHAFTTKQSKRYRYYICAKHHNEGSVTCPGSRVPAGEFERFVADQIRAIGRNESLLAATANETSKQITSKQSHLTSEQRRLDRERQRLDRQPTPTGDAAVRLTEIDLRLTEIAAELASLGTANADLQDLRVGLAEFLPVWDQLFPREQERILRLLIKRITYDPDTGDVELDLHETAARAIAGPAKEAS
jgi:site-specific DNA recombinase